MFRRHAVVVGTSLAVLAFGLTGPARAGTTGTITEYSTGISASATPYGIAAGPDGNLWFTEYEANRIGRITPAGTVTEYTGLTAGAGPVGITAGPDENLWFTEFDGNRIGRITPTGTITEYTGLTGAPTPLRSRPGPMEMVHRVRRK